MPKKRVLHLASWYPNKLDITLGIFTRRHILASLEYQDATVIHIAPDPNLTTGTHTEVSNFQGIKEIVVYYRPVDSLFPIYSSWLKMKRYVAAFRMAMLEVDDVAGLDLLHVHVAYRSGLLGKMLHEELGIPMVITEHWTGYHEDSVHYTGYFKKKLISSAVKVCSCVMPVTTHLGDAMLSRGLIGKYHVVPNVVDTDFFKSDNSKIRNQHQVLIVAALDDEQKNINATIEVLLKVKEKLPDLSVVIAGDGPDADELYATTIRSGAGEMVNFTGNLSPEDIRNYMQTSSLLILFSNYENQPCVLIEAMACGLQVLATDVGGVSEMIPEACGKVIPCRDETALYANTIQMLSQPKNDIQELTFHAQKYNMATVGKQINEVYESVLKKHV